MPRTLFPVAQQCTSRVLLSRVKNRVRGYIINCVVHTPFQHGCLCMDSSPDPQMSKAVWSPPPPPPSPPLCVLPKGTRLFHQRTQGLFANGGVHPYAEFNHFSFTPYYGHPSKPTLNTYEYKVPADWTLHALTSDYWPEDLCNWLGVSTRQSSYATYHAYVQRQKEEAVVWGLVCRGQNECVFTAATAARLNLCRTTLNVPYRPDQEETMMWPLT